MGLVVQKYGGSSVADAEGVKRVDVGELYDPAEYRPKVRHVAGKPMFLY